MDPDVLLTPARIEAWEREHGRIPAGARVLLRAGRSRRTDAAAFLNVAADGPHSPGHGAGTFGLASLRNLDRLLPTGAIVIAAPLKIVNDSGSPVRVIAITPTSSLR